MDFAELTRRRGAVPVLAELARRGALTMDEFGKAAAVTERIARPLRDALSEWGLVRVSERPLRGFAKLMTIEPTEAGLAVGRKFAEAEVELLSHQEESEERHAKAARGLRKMAKAASGEDPA